MGAALVGGALASLPGAGWASHKGTPHGDGEGGGGSGKSACAKYCKTLFGGDTAAQEECVSEGAHGAGPCYSCTPGVGPGPGFTPNCTGPKMQFNANTCQCACTCPDGSECVSAETRCSVPEPTSGCTCVINDCTRTFTCACCPPGGPCPCLEADPQDPWVHAIASCPATPGETVCSVDQFCFGDT